MTRRSLRKVEQTLDRVLGMWFPFPSLLPKVLGLRSVEQRRFYGVLGWQSWHLQALTTALIKC